MRYLQKALQSVAVRFFYCPICSCSRVEVQDNYNTGDTIVYSSIKNQSDASYVGFVPILIGIK